MSSSRDVRELLRDKVLYTLPRCPNPKEPCLTAFSPDGKRLVTCIALRGPKPGDPQAELRLHKATDGQSLQLLGQTLSRVNNLVFSPDGRLLAVAADKSILLWDTTTWKEVRTLDEAVYGPHLAFHPNGRVLVSIFPHDVCLWDIASGKLLRKFPQGEDTSGYDEIAVSPDGKLLAGAFRLNGDTSIRLWELPSGKELAVLPAHSSNRSTGLAFRRDNRWLASSGSEGKVKIWDVSKRKLLYTLQVPKPEPWSRCSNVGFTPDDRWLYVETGSGIRLWDLAPSP